MFTILIVDDEKWSRSAIIDTLDWQGLNLILLDEAKNGAVAKDLILQKKPDIVLTDIRMPTMDGIALLEWMHAEYPDIVKIVISGFSDFEYARKALTFQAFDYLLKPIEERQLNETMGRAVGLLLERANMEQRISHLTYRVNETGQLARDAFLTNLISGASFSEAEIRANCVKHGIVFQSVPKIVAVVRVDNLEQIAMRSYRNDMYLAAYALFNVCNELFEKDRDALVFLHTAKPGDLIIVKDYHTLDFETMANDFYSHCGKVIELLRKVLKFEAYIGIGREFTEPAGMAVSYRQASEAAQSAGLLDLRRIVHIDEIEHLTELYIYPDDKEKALIYYVENGYKQQATSIIDAIFREMKEKKFNPQSIRDTVLELAVSLNRILRKHRGSFDEPMSVAPSAPELAVGERFTLQEFQDYVLQLALQAIEAIASTKRKGPAKMIAEIKKYVESHYRDNINLNKLAEHFFINPAYLSRLFKNEARENFNDYLTRLRMEAAGEMVKAGQLKISDISDLCGYQNPNYFLRKFKEFFGCTPGEYREQTEAFKRK